MLQILIVRFLVCVFRGLCGHLYKQAFRKRFSYQTFCVTESSKCHSAIFSPSHLTSSSLEQLKASPQKRSSASSSPNKPTPPPPPPSSSPPPLSSSASPGLQAGRSQSSKPCKYGLRQNRRRPSTREVSCWLQEVCFPHQFFPSEITNCTLCMLRCCRIQTIQWR